MQEWLQVLLVAAAAGAIFLVIILIIGRLCCCTGKRKERSVVGTNHREIEGRERLQPGTEKLHHVSLHHLDRDGSRRTNYYVFRRGQSSTTPFFTWNENPSLVTDAVENGWSRFAFSAYNTSSSQSVRSAKSLFNPCATGENDRSIGVEIGWEVSPGSADFMQKIRLNSGLKKVPSSGIINNSMAALSAVKTALPLPGPPLGNSAFPQEAYFEITILPSDGIDRDLVDRIKGGGKLESDKVKLIQEDFNAKVNPETLIHVTTTHSNGHGKLDDFKHVGKDNGKVGGAVLSVGLAVGGPPPVKFPGCYQGSVGFNSSGSVFLDGMKLVYESAGNDGWGRADTVIGCGYNPAQKKVFFTVNSVLVHEIHCKSEEFGAPLYPTLAANSEVTVLVNLGQCAFKYAAANSQRTPNPCFIGPFASSSVIGYDDSKELFSMGRIDAQWLNRSATRSSNTPNNNNLNSRGVEFDEESEGDLFEIVLDSSKSPMTNT